MKILHVYSGGMDSTVLLADLLNAGHEVECLNFEYGSKHNAREREAAREVCKYYRVPIRGASLDLNALGFRSSLLSSGTEIPEGHYAAENMKSTVVPFRNAIMGSIAVGLAESLEKEAVSLAVHGGDHTIYPDCRPTFFEGFVTAAAYGTWASIQVWTPYIAKNKTTIAEIGAKLNVPMHLSWTCYKGHTIHCGICGSCTERREAFQQAGVEDLTQYEVN